MSFLVMPNEVIPLARDSVQLLRSFWVYPTTVGLPVVPEDTWTLTMSSYGTVKSLSG